MTRNEIFAVLSRVTTSGIWIASPRHALRAAYLFQWWQRVFAAVSQSGDSFCVSMGASMYHRRTPQLRNIARAAGVCGIVLNGRQGRGTGRLSSLHLIESDPSILEADPIPLIFDFTKRKLRKTDYRQKVESRLSALFLTMGIRTLADVQPGKILPFIDEEIKLRRMTAGTGNAYRAAIWNFVRWLVYDRKLHCLARVLVELDAQSVKQCTVIRGGRQASRKEGVK